MTNSVTETVEVNRKMYTDLSWCPTASSSGRVASEDNYKYSSQPPLLQMGVQQFGGESPSKYTSESELELHTGTHSSSYNSSCGGGYYPGNNNEDSYPNDGGNEYYVQRYSPCYSVYENSQENPEGSVLLSHRADEMCESGNNATCMTVGRPPVKRRNTANKKERRRTQSINNAFAELRDCIPNVPNDTKLSKIKTLRLARSYIAYLSDVLSGDDMCSTPAAFTAEISRKSGRGDERRKKELLMAEIKSSSVIESGGTMMVKTHRKTKGRTGWPQHVWAQELQQ